MKRLLYPLFIFGVSLWVNPACSDLEESSARSEFQDDDAVAPSNVSGSFLTSCSLSGGAVGCGVEYKGKLLQLTVQEYGYSPKFDLFNSKDLFNDTPESIQKMIDNGEDGAFKYQGSSIPKDGSKATFSFSFLNLAYMLQSSTTTNQLSYEEKRSVKVGKILTYSDEEYNPSYPKKFAKIDRCLLGVMMDNWLTSGNSDYLATNITIDDLKTIKYVGSDPRVLAIDTLDGTDYRAQWTKSIQFMIDTYIDYVPDDQPEGEPYTCREEYNKFKEGLDNSLFTNLEKEIGELVYDFLFVHKGHELPL